MTISAHGFCNHLGFAPNHFKFNSTHFSFAKGESTTYNQLDNTLDYEWYILHQFDNGVQSETTVLPDNMVLMVNNVLPWIIKECVVGGKLTSGKAAAEYELNIAFVNQKTEVFNLVKDSSNKTLPSHFKVTDNITNDEVTIYLLDTEMNLNYPHGDIVVFHIGDEIDRLNNTNKNTILQLLDGMEPLLFQTPFSEQTSKKPATVLKVLMVDWVNRNNPTETESVPFGCTIYGNAKNNQDGMITAIRDFITSTSKEPSEDWEITFPGLFNVLTFLLVPDYKVASGVEPSPRYNPISTISYFTDFIKNKIEGYDGAYVDTFIQTLPTAYQSLLCYSCPSLRNPDGFKDLTTSLPDYISVGPTEPGFLHLSVFTRGFVVTLLDALLLAERFPETSSSKPNLAIEVLDELTYITFIYGTGRYRVLTKASFNAVKD